MFVEGLSRASSSPVCLEKAPGRRMDMDKLGLKSHCVERLASNIGFELFWLKSCSRLLESGDTGTK